MSKTIEERIVSMGLDNASFEKHAAQSLQTLDKLEGVLDSLGKQGGTLLVDALESITSKFSILGTIGDEVLRKLADGLVSVAEKGMSLAKSLSIDQISAGWSKYADKTQAVQTIMAATSKDWTDTGAQMDYVSAQLDKLNWFTDETSYSFLDMVNNIGKFTSNGIGLEESVTAMEGISTWAAISGANVQEAGRAMYNLSQALATGSVKLMDWKSIENANMATREFKETALETAVSLGTLTKSIDAEGKAVYKTAKNHEFYAEQFNTYLSDAWFSKEVLTTTLKQYGEYSNVLHKVSEETGMTATAILQEVDAYQKSGKVSKELLPYIEDLTKAEYDLGRRAFKAAQEAKTFKEALDATKDAVSTGWMNTFEQIFGNYEEAKVLWTSLANGLWEVFASNGESRNMALKLWRELGQRARLFNDELDESGNKIGAIYRIGGKFIELFDELHGGLLKIFGPEVDPGEHEEDVWQLYTILTKVTDKIENFANAFEFFVDKLIARDVIGRFIRSFHDIAMGIKMPLEIIKETFHNVFDPIAKFNTDFPWANALVVLLNKISVHFRVATMKFRDFMESAQTMEEFSKIGYGIMAIFKIGLEFVKEFSKYFGEIGGFLTGIVEDVIYELSRTGEFLTRFKNTLIHTGALEKVAETLAHVLEVILTIVEIGLTSIIGFVRVTIENLRVFEGFFNTIIDAINNAAKAVNEFFADEGETFGWEKVVNTIYGAFRDFFAYLSSGTGQKLLSNLANAIVSVFEIAGMVISSVHNMLKDLSPYVKTFVLSLLDDISSLLGKITDFKNGLKESGVLEKVFSVLGNVLKAFIAVATVAHDIIKAIFRIIGENIHVADGLGSKILDLVNKFADWVIQLKDSKDWGQKFYDTFSSVHGILEKVFTFFEKMTGFITDHNPLELLATGAQKAWDVIQKVFGFLKDAWNNLFSDDNAAGTSPIKQIGLLGAAALVIKKLFGSDKGIFERLLGGDLIKSFKKTLESVGEALDTLTGQKDDIVKKLRNIAISLGILALAIAIVANIDAGKLAIGLGALTAGLAEMVGVIKIMDSLDLKGKQTTALLKIAAAMLAFGFALGEVAVAMVIFSAAVWVISKIDPDKLAHSIEALVIGLAAMTAALFLLAKFCKGRDLLGAGTAILEVAAALDLLVIGITVLTLLNPVKVSRALQNLVAALAAMTLALLVLAKACNAGELLAAGAAILLVAAAMDLMALALAGLTLVDSDKLVAGMIVLGTMLAVVAVVLVALSEVALPALGAAFALVIVGAALDLMAVSMVIAAYALDKVAEVLPKLAAGARSFEDVKWDAIAKAGTVLAGVIVALFALQFATIRDGTPALRELAEAMPILANGFKTFEILNPEAIERGGEALATAIKALFKLQFATIRDGTPALIELGMAMPAVAMGFKTFEILNAEAIAKGGEALAFAIGALFGLQLATFRDGTSALYDIGMAMPAVAMGFSSFDSLDADRLISVGNALTQTIKSLFNLQFASFRDGTEQLVNLGNSLPPLASGFKAFDGIDPSRIEDLCISLEKGLRTLVGNALKNLFKGDADFVSVASGLTLLAQAVKAIPENSADILTGLATGITTAGSTAVTTIEQVATKVLQDLDKMVKEADKITKELVPNMTKAVNQNRGSFDQALKSIGTTLTFNLTAMKAALSTAISAMNLAVSTGLSTMSNAVSNSISECENAVSNRLSNFYSYGYQMATNLAQGIYDSVWQVRNAAIALAEAAEIDERTTVRTTTTTGQNISTGLATGINNNSKKVIGAVNNLTNKTVSTVNKNLKVKSPSRVMMEIGGFVAQGLAIGIQNGSDEVEESMITVINPLLAALSQLMDEDYDFSPKITPVVDMSNVDAMASDISSYFSDPTYTVNAARRVSANESASGVGFGNYNSVGDTINASINVYAQAGQDVNELARVIERRLVRLNKQQQVGAL
jgi:tape measure domain-containing protein